MSSKLKVIFIAGTGRCGSTLLDVVLGQIPGAISVGELRYLWKRGVAENRLCGTSVPFIEHPQWGEIIRKLYGSDYREKAKNIERLEGALRIRRMMGFKTKEKITELKQIVQPYASELGRVLDVLKDEFGTHVIIDSSKMPMHGFALAQLAEVDLRVIHLVRDRKAVVHSWNTSKYDISKGGMMNAQSVQKASVEWVLMNKWIERYLGDGNVPYQKVEYAAFAENPVKVVNEIMHFVGEDKSGNPVGDDHSLDVLRSPSVSGNPMRFSEGRLVIKEDVRWRQDMPLSKKVLSDCYGLVANSLFFL